jgi:hypothetical protein
LLAPSACILDLPPALDDATAPPLSATGPEPDTAPEPDSDVDTNTDSDPPTTVPSRDAAPPGGSGGVPNDAGHDASTGNSAGMNPGGDGPGGGGSAGDGGIPSLCNAPLIECNGTCIAVGEPCCLEDCSVAFPHAAGECVGNVCIMGECEADFINCDSDSANGCEADFTFTQVSGTTMTAPRVNLSQNDPWANVPLVQLAAPCSDCTYPGEARAPQVAPAYRDPPPLTDLRAGFALGWSDTFLYLRAQVFDNSIPDAPTEGDARNYDNIEFLFDGDPSMINSQDDQHIFLAHDGAASDLNNASLDEVVAVSAERVGSCYWLTASLSTAFLSGLRTGGGQPTVQLSDLAVFAFNIGVNDFDLTDPLDPLSIEHQSHLFFRDPKNNYWFGTRMFPNVQLVSGP